MWNTPSQEQLDQIPRLYETENVPVEEKLINSNFIGLRHYRGTTIDPLR